MKKVLGKNFWLLMTMTGALMFGAPALVSASEGTASTDTENSAADDAANTPDDDTIAKTTDSTEKKQSGNMNIQERDRSPNPNISKMQKIAEKKLSPMKTRQIIPMDTTRLWAEQLFPLMKCVHYTTIRDALTHLKNSVAAEHLI